MKIFCIDSTSYIARIAIVEDGKCIIEERASGSSEKWNNMKGGDVSYLIDDFLEIIDKIQNDKEISVKDCDIICYSWYSGFKSTMNLGKIFAHSLGRQYDLEVLCIDHISSHYFSQFSWYIGDLEEKQTEFPILFFSASGSHNSLALMKSFTELIILNDDTYFEPRESKFLGLWSIYFRACRACEILNENEWANQISHKLEKIDKNTDQALVEEFTQVAIEWWIFDMNFHDLLFLLEENIESYKEKYSYNVIFRSFETVIFRIIEKKLRMILITIPCRQISIVWWIAQNNDFFYTIQKSFQHSWIIVSRPHEDFRFDNATMLWTLAYYTKKHNVAYPVSKIIT